MFILRASKGKLGTMRTLGNFFPLGLGSECSVASFISCFIHFQLFATPWTLACQGLLSMGFSRQEYWRGLQFSSPGDIPNPGIELTSPVSLALQVDSLPNEPLRKLQDWAEGPVKREKSGLSLWRFGKFGRRMFA